VQLVPGSVDSYMREGTALQWFKFGKKNETYDFSHHHFGTTAEGAEEGLHMCRSTMTDPRLCGVFRQANQTWIGRYGARRFGPTYRDQTPTSWATTFLACHYQQAFSRHLLYCTAALNPHRASTKNLPFRLRGDPRYSQYCSAAVTTNYKSADRQ